MSNSVKDILRSIDEQLKYLTWLRDTTGKTIWDGRIYQLERVKLEIEWRKINGTERK